MVTFRRILVGWDGSDSAEAALRMATSYADAIGSEIAALAVFDGRNGATSESDTVEAGPEYVRVTSRFHARFGDGRVAFRAIASRANPGRVLAEYADDHGFDLIAVGRPVTDGSGDHDHAVQALQRHATATVLAVATERTRAPLSDR
ncbi:MAG: universal stress protein [Acidimicrobiales bacterium]